MNAPRLDRTLLPLLAISLAACAPPRSAEEPARAPARASLSGELVLAKGGKASRGTLVMGYLTPEEAELRKAGKSDMEGFRRLLQRLRVVGEVDFAERAKVPYHLDAPPGAHPFFVLDVDHSFWATIFGFGPGYVGVGAPAGGAVSLTPNPTRAASGEPCSGPRYKLVVVREPRAEGAVKNPIDRRFCAYLPRSYEDRPTRRYPMVLFLPGLMSNEMARMRGRESVPEAIDKIARETSLEAIVVGVDTTTKVGSTYLEDSPVTGAFDTFLAGPAIAALERELRVIPDRDARALVGNSTGGLNAMSYGMRHPERFSAIGACSPDALDLPTWLFEPGSERVKPWIHAWTRLEDALGGPGQMASYAADWSPDPRAPRGFSWPFEVATGHVDAGVLARWEAHTPSGLLRDRSTRARVKYGLGGRIYITVAHGDEFDLHAPARRFSDRLFEHGVDHTFVATGGGHGEGSAARIEAALRYVVERLTPAR